MNCELCGKPIVVYGTHTGVYRRVVGWEHMTHRRASGSRGGSDITLREKRDEYAHAACVQLARSGVQPGQEALL